MVSGSRSPLIVMRDTRAWPLQVWVSFCLSTAFVLAKTLRDRREADLIDAARVPVHVQEQ